MLDEGKEVQPVTVSAMVRGEVDAQISTAKQYPRQVKTFRQRTSDLTCLDEETAASCIYAIPRAGKPLEGPSVRFAEIIAATWGNLRVQTRIVDEGAKYVVAQASCHDLENNTAICIEVQRKIVGKNKKRFSDDMIGVTANAATAIALRNAVLKVVPQAIWKEIYEETRKTAIGEASTIAATRAKLVEHFQKMGVPLDNLLYSIGKMATEEITQADIGVLRGVSTAIKDGDTSVDDAFPPRPVTVKSEDETNAEALAKAAKKNRATGTAAGGEQGSNDSIPN